MRSVVLTILFSAAATGGQIRGIVVDATGAAVESFIRIVESDSEEVPSRFRSEPSGLFQTKQLHDGVYFVTARR